MKPHSSSNTNGRRQRRRAAGRGSSGQGVAKPCATPVDSEPASHRSGSLAGRVWPAFAVAALLVLGVARVPTVKAQGAELPRFATFVSQPVDCQASPFGDQLFIGREDEFVELAVTAQDSHPGPARELHILQYPHDPVPDQGPALQDWLSTTEGLFNSPVFDMLDIDLDGDGQDEVVTASAHFDGRIRLDVLGYDKNADGGVVSLDHWLGPDSIWPQEVVLAKGDFDGSRDGHPQLAVLAMLSNGIKVFVLDGDPAGGIAEANGEYVGAWSGDGSGQHFNLAAGALLLDGRDQILIGSYIYESGGAAAIVYHLLELDSPNPPFAPRDGDTRLGGVRLQQSLAQVNYDDGGADEPDIFRGLVVRVGDVVDTAQAELVSFLEYVYSGENYTRTALRLQHLVTTHDEAGRIITVGIAERPDGRPFDSTVLANDSTATGGSLDATLANVDLALGREIVAVQATGAQSIELAAWKAAVDVTPGFSWRADRTFVRFTDTSTGAIKAYSWDFGDGSAPVEVPNPSHAYPEEKKTFTVTLTITPRHGPARSYAAEVKVDPAAGYAGGQTDLVQYFYKLQENPDFRGHYDTGNDAQMLQVATGDLNQDGAMEVLTLASTDGTNLLRSLWSLADDDGPGGAQEPYFKGIHQLDPRDDYAPLQLLRLAAPDFDGDSLQVEVGTDCRRVEEPQIRQLVWLPPYFMHLQADADKQAMFGRSTTGGSSVEHSAGSYTSHDVSGYIGATVSTPGGSVSATVKATAGYSFQQSRGAIHSTSHERQINQGYGQSQGEALLVLEENTFDCYSYDVSMAFIGAIPDSGVRMCEKIDGSRHMVGTDALAWDTTIPAARPDHPPAQWVSLHRDWASIALFRDVVSDVALQANQGAMNVTDGRFDTAAMSAGAVSQPWIEVDLGAVRDIATIRVIPAAGHAADLTGYRIRASTQPIHGGSSALVHSFAPMTADGSVYGRWDVWTRNRDDPAQMLKARYIQLAHEGTAPLSIAEIQVFGDVHVDPPRYPNAVCDADLHDGVFLARVWDDVHAVFRTVQVHGDLLWDATWNGWQSPWPDTGTCTNDGNLRSGSIWTDVTVGGSASNDWSLGSSDTNLIGDTTSFDSAIHVGAEFDLQAGFIASVNAGGSYEFATGLTRETQTSSYWTQGLNLGGSISGFEHRYAGLINDCSYNPRPYAYHLTDRSITGYRHDIYVVDYIVHQSPATWQRGEVSILCSRDDAIFASGFE